MPLKSAMKDHYILRRCLIDDNYRIGWSRPKYLRVGNHIGLIQLALNVFATRTGRPAIPFTLEFDDATGLLVTEFKENQTPPLLNHLHQLNEVVGKGTIAALDELLAPS